MAVLLGLLTSVLYGASDFCGGLATKRARVLQVVFGGHLVGLIGIFIAALLVADRFSLRDLALGAIGGAFGGIGLALLYRRLAVGPMSVVAPITALLSAAVPALWGLATGDRISTLAAFGVGLGLLAIVLVAGSGHSSRAPVTARVILESIAAGIGFGLLFIFLDATDAATSPWPVVGGRALTVMVLAPLVIAGHGTAPRDVATIGLIGATGVLDTAANATFLYATNEGPLTIVSVLGAQYAVLTTLLARVLLHERMTRAQLGGLVVATAGTTLIAAG